MKKRLVPVLLTLSLVLGMILVPALAQGGTVWDGKTYTEPQKQGEYYLIGTPEELMWWNQNGKKNSKARLTADIRLNDEGETINLWPVMCGGKEDNAFSGELDGNGYSILGLCIHQENTLRYEMGTSGPMEFADRLSEVGLFGYTYGAHIHDLGVEGQIYVLDRPVSADGDWLSVGSLVGFAKGKTIIENCWANVAITTDFSTDTWTEAGCALTGHPESCDVFVGGLVGSSEASAPSSWNPKNGGGEIRNCYSRGSCIVAQGRSTSVGGILGSGRVYTSSWQPEKNTSPTVDHCWSSLAIQVMPTGYGDPEMDSYVGGIMGDTAFGKADDVLQSAIQSCVALNPSLNADEGIHCGAVAGRNVTSVTDCQSHDTMTITGTTDGSMGDQKSVNEISYDGWNTAEQTIWDLTKNPPQLKKATNQDSKDLVAEYIPQVYPEDREWDGYVSDTVIPPYLNIWCETEGHNRRLVKKFTASELETLAEKNTEPLTYSVNNIMAERIIKLTTDSYIPLEELFENAGARFGKTDHLFIATRESGKALDINEPWLMEAPRFCYDYTSSSDTGISVPTVLALHSRSSSYNGESGSRTNAILFGQQIKDDTETERYMLGDEYGFTGILDMTIRYDGKERSAYTADTLLLAAIGRAEADPLSESGAFGEALAAAKQVSRHKRSTNEQVFAAMDALDKAERDAHIG